MATLLTGEGATMSNVPNPAVLSALKVLSLREPNLDRCIVAPSPDLRESIRGELDRLRAAEGQGALDVLGNLLQLRFPKRPGLNDGLIIPGTYFPPGTPVERVRSAAADRAPLRGTVRVIVVLVDFADRAMTETAGHFNDLFFSAGVLPNGSVREYFTEVSNGLIDLTGQVVGPYRLPTTLAQYANGASGMGPSEPNARTMARDAVLAADPNVNFGPYDNDGNGFVDAFIVIHAGPGAEQTGSAGHIWSHKWVLAGGEYATDGTRIFGYLTVPEDARIGVCAHELGHLLFGWPDLYDTDGSSEGIGNWCLMAGGSWNGSGDVPAHPSAWCKANQGWVSVVNQTTNAVVNIADVKDAHTVYRLWKDGASGPEYFLVENRQRNRYDAQLSGEGLLLWHIDESTTANSNENHYKVALMQADGLRELELGLNRGNAGDPFPGNTNNTSFGNTTNPNSKAYGGINSFVSVTAIGASGAVMSARLAVRSAKPKDIKERLKDVKDRTKEFKEPFKERIKDRLGEGKGIIPEKRIPDKRPEKPEIDKAAGFDKNPAFEKPGDKFTDKFRDKLEDGGLGRSSGIGGTEVGNVLAAMEARVAALEALLWSGSTTMEDIGAGEVVEPFIGTELRPDLSQGALLREDDASDLIQQMASGDPRAKRFFDKATES